MSKSNLFQENEKETITQNDEKITIINQAQASENEYHTFRKLSKEAQDDNITPTKKYAVDSQFATKNGEKILAVYQASDISEQSITRIPNDKDDHLDNLKNFKIMHNTSQNSSNLGPSNYVSHKTDSPSVEIDYPNKSSHPELNSILKESSKQIDKINKMLEEHKKKKALRHLNDSIERIDSSGASITEEYIKEMKAKLSNNLTSKIELLNLNLGPPALENVENFSEKKSLRGSQGFSGLNGGVFPSSARNYSLSNTNTPKSFKQLGTDFKVPPTEQSPKITKTTARQVTENLDSEIPQKNGSESARNLGDTAESLSIKQKSSSKSGNKIPVEDRLLLQHQQREVELIMFLIHQNRLKQLSQERNNEEMREMKSIPTISKNSKRIVQNSERLQKEREEISNLIKKEKSQTMSIEEQEEILQNEIKILNQEPKTSNENKLFERDEVVITEENSKDILLTTEEQQIDQPETKKKSVNPGSIYSRLRKKEERTYSEIFLQRRSKSPSQDNSKFNTPHNQSRQLDERLLSPKTAEILKKASTPKHILLKFELPNTADPKENKRPSLNNSNLKQDSMPNKSLSKQIEQLVGPKRKSEKPVEEKQEGFDIVQKLEIISNNLKQIKNGKMINKNTRRRSPKKAQESPEKPPKAKDLPERLTNESLMESVKLRKNKFFEIIDNSLSIRDKEEVMRDLGENQLTQADGYEIDAASKKWDEIPIYDRQALWLNARNSKVENLSNNKVKQELKECTFQPVLISKFSSPKNFTPSATPSKFSNSDSRSNLTDIRSKSRSLSKERKGALGSYHKWHEVKKIWDNTKIEENTIETVEK